MCRGGCLQDAKAGAYDTQRQVDTRRRDGCPLWTEAGAYDMQRRVRTIHPGRCIRYVEAGAYDMLWGASRSCISTQFQSLPAIGKQRGGARRSFDIQASPSIRKCV